MIQNILLNRMKSRPVEENILYPDAILQWWYFDAVLENGYRLVTFLMPRLPWVIQDKNHPLNEPMPFFEIILRKPDGENIRERKFINRSELKTLPDTFGAVFGSGCSFSYDNPPEKNRPGSYRIKGKAGGLGYDLKLDPELSCWAPLGAWGKTPMPIMSAATLRPFTKDYLYYVPFVPGGKISGELSIEGKSMEIRGRGYHEHGHANFPLYNFIPAWYWLHIEHPPWTIISSASPLPAGYPNPKKGTHGGLAFVQKGERRLFSTMDYSGLFVNWTRIKRRGPEATGENSMLWEVDLRIRRPGFKLEAEIASKDVLEFLHFNTPEHASAASYPYWGQTIADAKIRIKHRGKISEFTAECQLETVSMG